jgi:hypothetical protein
MVRRMATVALLLGTLIGGLGAPASADDVAGDVDPQDLLAQLPGIIDGLVKDRADMLRCPDLAGGTIGLPENANEPGRQGTDVGNPLQDGDASNAPRSLPKQVIFRSTTQTFNRRYQFALVDGDIWYKSNTEVTKIREPWDRLPASSCFAGKVRGISADDDELVAVDADRWIYGMDGALKTPAQFNWSLRWGPPFWTGPGRHLPDSISTWSWSVVSQLDDTTFTDDAGNAHKIGFGKVSHIWTLSHGGQRLTYIDPWLASDESYEMCSPHRGRFRSVNLSASGSYVFVIGRYGDLYTRHYDFDIAGADPIFFNYSYEDQRGVKRPKIQLPSAAWVRQPKIPGVITSRISIHKVGSGSIHRQLRVEGKRSGKVGYWHKDVAATSWDFTATGGSLLGKTLENPSDNTSGRDLGPTENRRYSGTFPGGVVTIPDFNTYCTPARVEVALTGGPAIRLALHTTDNIREFKRARGLDDDPRMFNGTLEIPAKVRDSTDPKVKAFLASLGDGRFIKANLDGTASKLTFRAQPWSLDLME